MITSVIARGPDEPDRIDQYAERSEQRDGKEYPTVETLFCRAKRHPVPRVYFMQSSVRCVQAARREVTVKDRRRVACETPLFDRAAQPLHQALVEP